MTILKSSPEQGSDVASPWAEALGDAWRRLEQEWQENVVETTPRWLVTVMVAWAVIAVVVLVAITGVAVFAF